MKAVPESEPPVVKQRPQWGSQWEFLMSCIATSVGLGNVWRFPFVCFENGGGAFLIPYMIVLVFIGKPMYYLETTLGQFSSSNCVKVWDVVPALRAELCPMLTRLYRVSYNSGTVPKAWKEGNVQPIPKEVDRSDPANYRPIAVTSVLCKHKIEGGNSKPVIAQGQLECEGYNLCATLHLSNLDPRWRAICNMPDNQWGLPHEKSLSITNKWSTLEENSWPAPCVRKKTSRPFKKVFSNKKVNLKNISRTGYAQSLSAIYILSYYMSIVALCLYYLLMTFNTTLPWSVCRPGWTNCVPSGDAINPAIPKGQAKSSAEFYFTEIVLEQKTHIHDGIGFPLWHLVLCLLLCWITVFLINARGVKTSGKASYFLALFPYVIMIILLLRAVTLPGAGKGIRFFITPEWSKILELQVWYAAVTQAFFSLSVCSGALIMFSSFNNFRQNIYRDSLIVTSLDTLTSMISGFTIFGVLGNLAFQLGVEDVRNVIKAGGSSLAFISYPDAIAQSPLIPQFFAFLFFLMMLVLGIGSGVALHSTVNTILLDAFPRTNTILLAGLTSFVGFFLGLPYTTPGGQQVLTLVDFYGGTFTRLFAAILETIGIFWIYGLENLCVDIEFMLRKKTCWYWRVCWSVITPVLMSCVFVYSVITKKQLKFGSTYIYPKSAYFAGSCLQYVGVALIPLFMLIAFRQRRAGTFCETMKQSFKPLPTYGPALPTLREGWLKFITIVKEERAMKRKNWPHHIILSLYGGYRAGKPIPE